MATIEQIRKQLDKRIKTVKDAEEFGRKLGGELPAKNDRTEPQWVKACHKQWLAWAMEVRGTERSSVLDLLGMGLGLPSDTEAARRDARQAGIRSWVAIGISLLALAVAAAAWLTTGNPESTPEATEERPPAEYREEK